MTKFGDTRKQKRNDLDARHKAPLLPDDRKQMIAEMKKHLKDKPQPDSWNSAINKCINIVKEL